MRRPDDKSFHLEKAKQVCSNMDRLDKMITDLLDISRIQAGEADSHDFKKCNLNKLVRHISEESNVANEGRVVVQSDGDCIGCWHEDGLRRVIENLISNAVKYGRENSPVIISLTQDAKSGTVSVHNDGDPIPVEEEKLLFQQFKRSNSAEGIVGWGLGLAVVQTIVEAHGGTIRVNSDAKNGTAFIFNLPKTQIDYVQSNSNVIPDSSPKDASVNR